MRHPQLEFPTTVPAARLELGGAPERLEGNLYWQHFIQTIITFSSAIKYNSMRCV